MTSMNQTEFRSIERIRDAGGNLDAIADELVLLCNITESARKAVGAWLGAEGDLDSLSGFHDEMSDLNRALEEAE